MIIITGAAGFIGSNLLAALSQRNQDDIVVSDWLGNDSKWKNVSKHYFDHFVHPEDLFSFLDKHRNKIKAIFHLGAVSSTTEIDADYVMSSNFKLTQNLWDYCVAHDVRFIYASSAATYGDGHLGFDDMMELDELRKLRPLNPYGWSKHIFDQWAIKMCHQGTHIPPQFVGLKFFNVYGPNEYHKAGQRSVAHQIFEQIKKEGKVKLFKSYKQGYEDGGQKRDFVYVKDCVKVMLWCLDHPKVSGLFNVGTGHASSFKELAQACFKALDMPEKIDYIEMPENLKSQYQYFTQARMSKLLGQGYKEKFYTIEQGIKDYFGNYLSQDPYA